MSAKLDEVKKTRKSKVSNHSPTVDIPEITTIGETPETPNHSPTVDNPNTVTVVLTKDPQDLSRVNWTEGNTIVLWYQPQDIAGIIETNMKIRHINKTFKEEKLPYLAELAILDLTRAGYPPLSGEDLKAEYLHLADLYVRQARKIYGNVNLIKSI